MSTGWLMLVSGICATASTYLSYRAFSRLGRREAVISAIRGPITPPPAGPTCPACGHTRLSSFCARCGKAIEQKLT